MIYARMPEVSRLEQQQRAEPLDARTLSVSPADAVARLGVEPPRAMRLGMLQGRPVYRLPGPPPATVFADTGEVFAGTTAATALATAARWSPANAVTLRDDGLVTTPDQWTLQLRQHLPLHRITLGDDRGATLYVSGPTGEVVMDTTRSERLWAYLGPVTHWLYAPVLRRNGARWTQVILWLSALGCVSCVAGLVLGVVQYSPAARFRLGSTQARSPYAGLMRWHHYAGLLFGVVTLTWTFSGLLSMDPFPWLADGAPPAAPSVEGAPGAWYAGVSSAHVQMAVAALARDLALPELELVPVRGEPYWMSEVAPGAGAGAAATSRHQVIAARRPDTAVFARFADPSMEQLARDLLPGVAITDHVWLPAYDAYYYDRQGERPLPVLRVRYADAAGTWLYLDPRRGAVAMTSRRGGRWNRWLYHGLHSIDVPWLYPRRPLWDVVLIALSLGGLALAGTSLMPAWRRVRRHTRSRPPAHSVGAQTWR